jgi:hypothetical protein
MAQPIRAEFLFGKVKGVEVGDAAFCFVRFALIVAFSVIHATIVEPSHAWLDVLITVHLVENSNQVLDRALYLRTTHLLNYDRGVVSCASSRSSAIMHLHVETFLGVLAVLRKGRIML